MQEITGLISIIIPAYNAAAFVRETITSVQNQTYQKLEIIVVNDGSSDATSAVVKEEADQRLKLIEQNNSGVSSARNKGFENASGEYILFLDADDLLTPHFIESRVNFLTQNPGFGFAGGLLETFPLKTSFKKAAAENPEREILFFDSSFATVPSNYVFRKKMLLDSGIRFNINLNSTADRFFILQVSKYTKGKYIDAKDGRLLYRISSQSMSHKINPALILDNEFFYKELIKENLLPVSDTAKFKSQYLYSLSLGFAKVKYFKSFIKYSWRSFVISPVWFIKSVAKTLKLPE